MTLDQVLTLKADIETAFQDPPRFGLGLAHKWIDEGRANSFVRSLLDTPARHLPLVFETSASMLVAAAKIGRRPRGNFIEAALVAQGDQAAGTPNLSVGYAAIGRHNYRAEVRFQDPDVRTVLLVQEIVHRAKGDARVGEYRDMKAHAGKSAENGNKDLPIGSSVGHRKGPPGTLGLFVRSAEGVGIVSNSHILAWSGRARANDPIFAPHPSDSKEPREIGQLRRYSDLIHEDVVPLDLAFALLREDVRHRGNMIPPGVPDAGKSVKSGQPLPVESIGLNVKKIGRTSRSTSAKITAFDISPKLLYVGLGEVKLTGMVEVEWPSPENAFSEGGDSGSVVYRSDTMEAIGLVVGGGVREVEGAQEGVTIVCPLTPAMKEWGLSPL